MAIDNDDFDDPFVDADGICRCFDCQTFFNTDVTRPIIEVTADEATAALSVWNDERCLDRLARYNTNVCPRHASNELLLCKLGYASQPDGTKCICAYYRRKRCHVKYELHMDIMRLPDDPIVMNNAWGACSKKTGDIKE